RDEVVFPREAFAPATDRKAPGSWLGFLEQRLLEVGPVSGTGTRRVVSAPAALEAITSQEAGVLLLHVAEARDVDAIGAPAIGRLVFHASDRAARSCAEAVVHHVAAQLPARIAKPGRKPRGRRIQQNPRRLERRCTEENEPRSELDRLQGERVDG